MDITLDFTQDKALIKVEGNIASDNAHLFQEQLDKILASEVSRLDLDLAACKNISSSGIGKLLIFYKKFMKRNGKIEIVKSSPTIYELLTTIKLDQLFTINY